MRVPCRRRTGHRHLAAWLLVPSSNRKGHLSDRCRSLHLWSTVAFHVLAGDRVTLDGQPFTDRTWAERYLKAMEADPMARSTARGVRLSLDRRGVTLGDPLDSGR
jgi:hypothetical protein